MRGYTSPRWGAVRIGRNLGLAHNTDITAHKNLHHNP